MPIYVQLEDQLLKVSGDVTSQSIEDALGYKPVSKDQLNNYYTKDEINSHIETDSLTATFIDAAIVSAKEIQDTDSNAFNITDKDGNIITTIDGVGIATVEVTLKDENGNTLHQLSQKANKDYVDQKFLELDNYYTKDEINSHIETDSLTATFIDAAIVSAKEIQDTDSNAFNITDKDGNIITTIDGVGIATVEVTLKDKNGNTLHQLSQKANKDYVDQKFLELDNYYTKDEINSHIETDSLTATSIDAAIVSTKEIQDTDSNAFNITDKDGNIITTIDGVGIATVEVTLKDKNGNTLHQLSQKANKDYVDQRFLELDNYYTKDEINSHIETDSLVATSIDAAIVSTKEIQDTDSNAFNITDKDGNIITTIDGIGISTVEVALKDENGNTLHQLSQKANKDYVDSQDTATLNAAKEYAKAYADGLDSANDTALATETSERKAADTALGIRIDNEITNRGNEVSRLEGLISKEVTDRTNADSNIRSDIATSVDTGTLTANKVTVNNELVFSNSDHSSFVDDTNKIIATIDGTGISTVEVALKDENGNTLHQLSQKANKDYVDSQDTATLNAAKEYAKTYTDGQITEVKSLITASTQFLGVATNEIKDQSSTKPIISSKTITPGDGDIVMYSTSEFIWSSGKWYLLGDTTAEMNAIKDLQAADTALGTRITNEITNRGNEVSRLESLISKEVTDRTNADADIRSDIETSVDTGTLTANKVTINNELVFSNSDHYSFVDDTNKIIATIDGTGISTVEVALKDENGDTLHQLSQKANKDYVDSQDTATLNAAKTYANGLNTAMDTRVDALETAKHTHNNKTVLDGINATKVSNWDNAEANAKAYADGQDTVTLNAAKEYAKTYADGLNTAMDTRVDALETAKHTHSNKTVLDGITEAKVSNWDNAEANAKDYADSKVKVVADVVGNEKSGLVQKVNLIQGELDGLSGGAGSITTQIENVISALDLPNTYETKGTAAGLNDAMDTRVDALETAKHTHNNKTVLDGITTTNVSNWDNAEANAKAYADSQDTATLNAAKAYANELDSANDTALATEASERKAADKALGTRIDNEKSARETGDSNTLNSSKDYTDALKSDLAAQVTTATLEVTGSMKFNSDSCIYTDDSTPSPYMIASITKDGVSSIEFKATKDTKDHYLTNKADKDYVDATYLKKSGDSITGTNKLYFNYISGYGTDSNSIYASSNTTLNIKGYTTLNLGTKDGNVIITGNGNLSTAGSITSTSGGLFDTSDERLKDFQNDIEVDFEKLSKLPKKYFTWKDGDGKLQIGTSAQEVQKVYPELVNEDENGTLSVSYNKLSIIALKAVDELYKKNQELEKRLERLEKLLA